MSKETVLRGQTANLAFVFLPDSTSTTGAGKTGLTNGSAGLLIAVRRELSSAATAYSGGNIGTISTLGTWVNPGSGKVNFKEVDSVNLPGLYELHFENTPLGTADASRKLVGMVTATGVAPTPFEVALVATDQQDSVRLGLTALPNAAAEASGGLYTRGTGPGQIRQDSNGRVDVNAKAWLDGTIPAPNVTGIPKVDIVDWQGSSPDALSSGKIPADLKLWLTTAPLALSSQLVQSIVAAYASGQAPLQPTTAGRTLDVATTGEAGVDLDNIKDASTPHTLANITMPTTTTVTNRVTANADQIEGVDATDQIRDAILSDATRFPGADIDAAISSRSSHTAADVWASTTRTLSAAGVQAIWDRLTSALTTAGSIGKLLADNVTASISAVKSKTDLIPVSPAAVGSVMQLDLTQAVPPLGNTDETIGDVFAAARAQGFGKWEIDGFDVYLYAADNTTVVKHFVMDSATNPSSRTPV